ncbi:MAG: helix-turn-helix domain-containing protein [Actinomycetia bacterium]|nr:helix-turn-helix domain-containing protein [Actinomycetes bacterium]
MPLRAPRAPRDYGRTIAGAERARIVALIREGHTRNDIARRVGRSGSTVGGIAKAEGLEFAGRAKVAAATAARNIDLAARRAEVKAALLEDAMRLREQMWRPCKVYSFGGRDNTYAEHDASEPPPADKRALMQAAATALGRHMDLDAHDADQRVADARSMLTRLGAALGVAEPDA